MANPIRSDNQFQKLVQPYIIIYGKLPSVIQPEIKINNLVSDCNTVAHTTLGSTVRRMHCRARSAKRINWLPPVQHWPGSRSFRERKREPIVTADWHAHAYDWMARSARWTFFPNTLRVYRSTVGLARATAFRKWSQLRMKSVIPDVQITEWRHGAYRLNELRRISSIPLSDCWLSWALY